MRGHQLLIWALLAAVAAYLLLMAAGPLNLLGRDTSMFVGSAAALAIGLSAAAFVAVYLITRARRRG